MMSRARVILAATASVAVLALVATLAVLWPGYDARHVPVDNVTVWALQTGDGKRYARVNTELGELDTVKEVENPSGIVQHGDATLVFTDGQQRFARINPATPINLDEHASDAFASSPSDTQLVVQEGEWVAYLSSTGQVHASRFASADPAAQIPMAQTPVAPMLLDPFGDVDVAEGEEKPTFQARAIAVNESGTVAIAGHGRVVLMSAVTGGVIGEDPIGAGAGDGNDGVQLGQRAQLTFAGDDWVLFDPDAGVLWSRGSTAGLQIDAAPGALLQRPANISGEVLIADTAGMLRVPLGEAQGTETNSPAAVRLAEASGTPARPLQLQHADSDTGDVFGAWLGEDSGTLWSEAGGIVPLGFGGESLGEERAPEFVTNGSRAILNEQRTGWVWSLPNGELMGSSQHWRIDEQQPEVTDEVETQRVNDPKPPVAEPDHFGVRAGRHVTLPVLLNDHDPNEDVLSIIRDSLEGLDPAFGTLSLTNNEQQVVVQVAPDATGSASFTYRITDGTTAQGLNSQPARVTLTVVDADENTAPQWCGTVDCLAEWPSIEVVPGGTATVNVLPGWVDPEGDPLYLRGALQGAEVGNLLTTPTGEVTYQHPDPNSTESKSFTVELDVVDAHGAATVRPLTITVNAGTELALEPFAVTGALGQRIHLDFTDHIARAAGAVTLTSLSALDGSELNAQVNRASLVATVQPATPGSYVLQATVNDGATEANGIVRVTVVDPATTPITTTPLTAFIHPGEDTTVDVLPAISDPAGSVLLVSDLKIDRDDDATLSVDIIGQRYLRATGDTFTGEPGTLGTATFTVSDGSKLPHRIAEGEITFVLLPPADAVSPIAVDDRVTVRAGAQIDISVLENDSVPSGAQIQVDPSKVINEHSAGLAFATSRMLRYLAPQEPGDYSVSYTVYRLGFPSLTDTARVHITVIGEEGNTAPTPALLEGRVHSGRSVVIPFDRFGSDPDGDAVVLDRIATQPEHGSATVSAEGDAIIYTSAPQFAGQVNFTYQVRDEQGDTGVGEVRVGVLDSEVIPNPVTYSDYVQVQVGETSETVVHPLENDIEPNGSPLTLVDVRPNAPNASAEFDALEHRLVDVDHDTGAVRIRAGEELGTSSYVYTVRNDSGDVSMGLIIVKVVREPVPDYPHVRDTILNAETLAQFPQGIDVVSGQVSWATGDVASLDLGIWGDLAHLDDLMVDGWRISGEIPERALTVPFEVSGASFSGNEVTSYGFLRVPGNNDVKLSLRQAFAEVTVDEQASVEVDLAEAVRIPDGAELELLASDVSASGARAEGRCQAVGDMRIRYEAGSGAPWQDVCRIPVKLATQTDWTYLSLAVRVIAEDPQPELRAATLTVSPGTTSTYELRNMVTWQGQTDFSALQYSAVYQGAEFEVTAQGGTLTVTATDIARPSRQEPVVVSLTSHPEVAANTLNITVGPAPSTLPRGASVSQQCSQGGGSTSCLIPVIGGGGEVNPLPGTPLQLVSAAGASNCEAVSFSVENDSTVRATWAADAPGAGDCTGSFVVEDAQGRQSTGDRAGQIVLDLQGLPANPTRVDWVSYQADSVTLQPVAESSSYPAVTAYTVRGAGKTVECGPSGPCEITGLTVGQQTEFTATAVNSVGTSRGDASVTAWAYRPPEAPKNGAFVPEGAGARGELAKLTVGGIDPTTEALQVRGPKETRTIPVRGETQVEFTLAVENSPRDVTVTPTTRFTVPPERVGGGESTGQTLTVREVHGVGAPRITDTSVSSSNRQRTVTVRATFTDNGDATAYVGFARSGDTCVADTPIATGQSHEHVFTNVPRFSRFTPQVCARHIVNGVEFPVSSWSPGDGVTLVIPEPTGSRTYSVGSNASQLDNGDWVWPDLSVDVGTEPGYELRFDTGDADMHALTFDELFPAPGSNPPAIYAKLCDMSLDEIECGDRVLMQPSSGSAPFSPIVSFGAVADGDGFCLAEDLTWLDAVTITGLASAATVSERMSADGTNKWIEVSFAYNLQIVESAVCQVPIVPEEPEPEEPGDPDPGTPGPDDPGDPGGEDPGAGGGAES